MNWEAIGAIGEIIGAVAVVGTLWYLAVQIRHSSNQSTANMASTVLNEFNRMQEALFANPHTSALLSRVKAGEDLSDSEETQLESIANRYITHWYQIQLAHERKLVDDVVYLTMCEDVKRILTQYPPLKNRFREILGFYSVSKSIPIFDPIFAESDETGAT
jgi:hypothetical protein